MAESSTVSVFGIRHHGPGSARALAKALAALAPDVVLIEGPPDANEIIGLAGHPEMRPPASILVYASENPKRAVFYPFTTFSPEWQAIQYGLRQNLPVRFIDLPHAHQLLDDAAEKEEPEAEPGAEEVAEATPLPDFLLPPEMLDPLGALAKAAGFEDGERWWEQMVEHRRDERDLFAAILEAMSALREGVALPELASHPHMIQEARREAHMRQMIRAAQREGFGKIAVVCGAWHAPVLADMPAAKEDAAILKGLPKVKVQATWVPWSNGRLSWQSGYGAGVQSPGWYQHLWDTQAEGIDPTGLIIRWMAKVAALLRGEDLDTSSASVIEAVRLAEALASVRDRSLPGLLELNEACQTALCFGEALPLRLIERKLIVGEVLGQVPPETPAVPLQQDLAREQKRLRLAPEAAQRVLDLDLRKENDLARSRLLHRLKMLDLPWGELEDASGKKGTFHELWRLQWEPEFAVKIVEAAIWGNTVPAAAAAKAKNVAAESADLPSLIRLLDDALLADLPEAVDHLMERLKNQAALATDVAQLMDALPALAQILRYGNVRQTDSSAVSTVVGGLVARICIGLPGACASLNDEAAQAMFEKIQAVNGAVTLLQNEGHSASWTRAIEILMDQVGVNGLLAGRSARILLEAEKLAPAEAARRMGLVLSPANDPVNAAAWVEGFLKGSGLHLLHDDELWRLLDSWVAALPADVFTNLLPLLRRTFSTFSAPERRQMGEKAQQTRGSQAARPVSDIQFDHRRAEAVLPLVAKLLGLKLEPTS